MKFKKANAKEMDGVLKSGRWSDKTLSMLCDSYNKLFMLKLVFGLNK
jgi:hypothetical protein